jgi:hypothetical protein
MTAHASALLLAGLCFAVAAPAAAGERVAVLDLEGDAMSPKRRIRLGRDIRRAVERCVPKGWEVIPRLIMNARGTEPADVEIEGRLERHGHYILSLKAVQILSDRVIGTAELLGHDGKMLVDRVPKACAKLFASTIDAAAEAKVRALEDAARERLASAAKRLPKRVLHRVRFETQPKGAGMMIDGRSACRTPCSLELVPGAHELIFRLKGYLVRELVFRAADGAVVSERLEPVVGWLTLHGPAPGIEVRIDGYTEGKTPFERKQVRPGRREVQLHDPRYHPIGKHVVITVGKHTSLDMKPRARVGSLEVKARDRLGKLLRLPVLLDGKRIGETPFLGGVVMGAHQVSVGGTVAKINIPERGMETLEFTVDEAPGSQP